MPFSIKAFIKFRILFTKTFIMPSLKINHLLILSSVTLGRIDLPSIELTVDKLFCSDVLGFTLSVVSYIYNEMKKWIILTMDEHQKTQQVQTTEYYLSFLLEHLISGTLKTMALLSPTCFVSQYYVSSLFLFRRHIHFLVNL